MIVLKRLTLPLLCALAGFLVLQIPAAESSFLGSPDRDMLGMGMKLRKNTVGGNADPVVWVQIDDQAVEEYNPNPDKDAAPPITVPRQLLANILKYLRGVPDVGPAEAPPTVVVIDVDLSWPAESPEAIAALREELSAWAADPSAPPLVLARERLSTDRMLRPFNGEMGALMTTPYDDIVQFPFAPGGSSNPRVMWASTDVSIDSAARARDVVLGRCLQTVKGRSFLPNAAFFAAHARESQLRGISLAQIARERFAQANDACVNAPAAATEEAVSTSLINFHFDASGAEESTTVAADWPGLAACGASRVLTTYPAADVAAAAGSPRMGVCGSIVVIGSQNSISTDSYLTPYGPMAGGLVLANAARGLALVGEVNSPERVWLRLIGQIVLVVIVVILAMELFEAIAKIRARVRMKVAETGVKATAAYSALLLMLNPVTVKWVVAVGAYWIGAVATAVGLSIGIWGVLAAPVYAAALSEAIREYANDS